MKDIEEIEEIMDEEPTPRPIIKKEKMTLAEVCKNIETILRNQYIEKQANWRYIIPPRVSVYISTLKLNPKNESDTVHRYSIGAFKIGEGDLEDILIDKGTGIPIYRNSDSYYFLTTVESDCIKEGGDLIDSIFKITKVRLQHSGIEATLNRSKRFTDLGGNLANMELTLWQ